MNEYRYEAIHPRVADELRRDPSAVPVRATSSPGFPCRQCMRDAAVGDELLLVAHDPFVGSSPYTGPTAIYLHRSPCESFGSSAGPPAMLRPRRLSVRGFGIDHMMVAALVVDGIDLEAALATLFAEPTVDYAQIHNAGPGCWNCRVRRVGSSPG